MAGGSEIKNELTLDVSQFTQQLERATNKLDSLGNKIDSIDKKSEKLEKDFKGLSTNVGQATNKIGAVTDNLDGLAGGLNRAHQAIKKSGDGSKRLSNDLSTLAQAARESHTALNTMGDWTAHYGKSLDTLRPKMGAIVQSQKELAKVTANMTKAEAKAIQTGIQQRIKDLGSEKSTNNERIKARKAMISQLEQMERRAETSAAFARADAYKTNKNGQEVRRYVGKNSAKHDAIMAEVEGYKKQAELARQQKAHISSIVGELQYRNNELGKALQAEQALLQANKKTLAAEKERVAQLKRTAEEKKRIANEEKRLLKELEDEQKKLNKQRADEDRRIAAENKRREQEDKKRLSQKRQDVKEAIREEEAEERRLAQQRKKEAQEERQRIEQKRRDVKEAVREQERAERELEREKARNAREERQRIQAQKAAQKEASREQLNRQRELQNQQKAAHQEKMKMLKEEHSYQKDMVAFATGAAVAGGVSAGVDQIATYQDTLDRLRAFNFSAKEFDEILARTDKLQKDNKFLTKTDALQGNIDAIAALAHNAPEFIDKTLDPIMKDAFILRSKGYDKATQSDLVKNLYGAIEARGLTRDEDAEAAEKTSDLLRRMVIASGGKVTVSDIETVFRNAGDTVMTISDEGWLKILPLIEQNKTAGGGNGGGGGVARVGTMIKMLSLMASGRKLTNQAALQFLGSDMMNDIYADGVNQDFTKIAQNNDVIQRSLTQAGFKDQDKISKDPIGALMSMRGGILDYMMRDDKFKTYFGSQEKHTYNSKGEMVSAKGEVVDSRRQNEIEMAAFKKFLAMTGISNNNVTGFATTMNAAYAQRAHYSVETAQNAKGRDELLGDLSENWKNNIDQLKVALANFAITFEPLLQQLVAIPKALASVTRGVTEFAQQHNVIASIALAFVGVKLAVVLLLGPLKLLMGIFRNTGGITTFKGALAGAKDSLGGVSKQSKDTGKDIDNLNAKSAMAGEGAKRGFGAMLTSALGAGEGVAGAVGGILRVLGLFLSWAGWVALGLMFGKLILGWISDIDVGGKTIGQHMKATMDSVYYAVWDGVNKMRRLWWDLHVYVGDKIKGLSFMADVGRQKLEDVRRSEEAAKTGRYNDANPEEASLTESQKAMKRLNAKIQNYHDIRNGGKTITQRQYVAPTQAVGDVPGTQGGYQDVTTVTKGRDLTPQEQADYDQAFKTMTAKGYVWNGKEFAPKSAQKKADWQVEGWNPTETSQRPPDEPLPTKVGDPKKANGGKSFEQQNAFFADFQAQRFSIVKDDFKLNELLGNPVSYQEQARAEFEKKWLAGEFDDGRDPSKRKFVKGDAAYDKDNGWDLSKLDTSKKDPNSGISGDDWIEVTANKLRKQAEQVANEFAAGKLGESKARLEEALDTYKAGVNADSSQTAAAKRQFGKYEEKNKQATEGSEHYKDFKALSLAALAGDEYISKITEYRKSNYENAKEFDENEIAHTRHVTKVKYEEAQKQREAYVTNLAERLVELESRGMQEQDIYKTLKQTYQQTQEEMTEFNRRELLRRQRDTESSYDQQMRLWRDYENTITQTLGGYGQKAATDLWDVITGEQKLDVGGFASSMLKDVGGNLFQSAWGKASKSVMGAGEGTNILDYVKNLMGGTQANESGMLGRWLNSSRQEGGFLNKVGGFANTILNGKMQEDGTRSGGLIGTIGNLFGGNKGDGEQGFFGSMFSKVGSFLGGMFGGGDKTQELTGDAALNANTSALQSLTQALSGSLFGTQTPVALPTDQAPPGTPIVPFEHREAVDPNEGPNDARSGGLFQNVGNFFSETFANIKTGFSSLFDSNGEGGIFSKIKNGFTNLFSENGGLMSKIGESFGSLFGGLTSALSGLLGGVGGKIAGVASGAMQGFASGGWAGAIAGGISSLFANGGAFGASGQVHAFAKGGAFTNQVVNSPTMFKFAKGGGFANGLMGEAGPEAVMPLQRDGSGRLGVAVNGGAAGGMVNNVSININVDNDGNATSSAQGDESQQWRSMSNKVRMVVLEELVKQKRPGGALA